MRVSYKLVYELALSGDEGAIKAKEELFNILPYRDNKCELCLYMNEDTGAISSYLVWKKDARFSMFPRGETQ